MKLKVTIKALCYNTKVNTMTPRDGGAPIDWYQIILDQDGDVGTFTCSQDVFNKTRRLTEYEFLAEYDEQNKRFKITDVFDSPADAPADTPADTTEPAPADSPADTPADTPAETTEPASADSSADAPTDKRGKHK